MIRRLLVANRGEIALRIIRACRELGIEPVAVYSDADTRARHVRAADFAVRVGPAPAAQSYLNIPALIDAARTSGADAVHPGYGLLSENAEFAAACTDAGLIFVGPPASVIARMGSKIAARDLMKRAGLPVVPGRTPEDQTDAGVAAAAREIDFPVVIKASAGGGGKGMRTVIESGELHDAIQSARREAITSFADGTLYVERLLHEPRHVEVQIVGDAHGNLVHLFERDCSIQRRHQKIIEETPSPAVAPPLRERLGRAAVTAAGSVGYQNAGTLEFLLEGEGDNARFYFLEMNTRLQVEHPITEAVTGVDLVRLQLRVAAGHPLPWSQDALVQRGHAIECRVYAEDPSNGFLPGAGSLRLYREPSGPGIRIDSGVEEGAEVPIQYDPMIAKVIGWGEDRRAAIARACTALRQFPILGVRTNMSFLIRVLTHPEFHAGHAHTGFVELCLQDLLPRDAPPPVVFAAAAHLAATPPRVGGGLSSAPIDPWARLNGWGRDG